MEPEEYKNLVLYKLKGEYPVLLTKKEKFLLRRKAALYDIEGEQLFYWRYKGTAKTIKTKVVCGAEEANTLFLDFHASPIGAHCGQTKTREAISKRFYWPGMSVDINNWVSQCAVCQASAATIKKPAVYIPIKVSQPFELVGMDLIGKLKETKSGNQYICVFIDYFTKWPQAYPLKTKSAKEVTSCLIKFVHQFEAPKRILTDQGKEFVNSLNKRVCDMLNIKRSLCSPYHPQTNGLVERMNGIIQRALCKVVGDHPETWDDYLDAVMFGLRTKKQMTTKYSPYYLMFGREARYPSEIPEHYVVDESVEDIAGQEDLSQDMLKHEKLLEVVKDNVFKAQENTKVKIQSTKKKIDFKVGDRVLRANIRSQQRKGGKLEPNFLGPYTITAIQDKSADLQDANGAIIPKVNIDQLKLSKNTISRVPHWGLKKQAQASVASLSSPSLQPAAQLLPAQPAITPPQQGPAAPSATRPTATAAPQATAATGSATASKTTASPPPPPPITAPDATVSPVTTPQPSQGQQATVPAVSDPGPGVTALQEDTPPASAPNTSAPAHASAPQATSPTSEPASETAAPNTASQAAAPDLASQATSSDPASQTAASDPALQATVPDPAPAPKAAESTASAPNTTAPAHATAAQATSTTAPEPASQTVAPDPASQATGPDPVPSQKDKAPTAPDLNLKASAPPHATAPPATAPTAPASDPQTTAPQASAPHATAPPATAPTAPASDPQTTAPQASAPQATAPTGSTTHQQSTAPSAASRPHRYTQAVAEKCIMDAWSGKNPHVLLSKIGAYKLFYWDITQTGPDMELESESINAYLAIMVRECNHQNSAKAAFIDSFAMTAVWNRKNTRLKIKPMEHEVIVGIVNEHHHWTLVVIYPQEKKSLYLDPLGETKQGIQKCLESTRAFMRKKGCNVSRWTCDTVKHPKQMDATSCGVFALKFAEKILRKESVDFPSTKKAINAHRLQIATILLLETDDLTNLCHFCGKEEHDTDFNWIQCDLCLRWFHQYCVNSPPPEESFICLACK